MNYIRQAITTTFEPSSSQIKTLSPFIKCIFYIFCCVYKKTSPISSPMTWHICLEIKIVVVHVHWWFSSASTRTPLLLLICVLLNVIQVPTGINVIHCKWKRRHIVLVFFACFRYRHKQMKAEWRITITIKRKEEKDEQKMLTITTTTKAEKKVKIPNKNGITNNV